MSLEGDVYRATRRVEPRDRLPRPGETDLEWTMRTMMLPDSYRESDGLAFGSWWRNRKYIKQEDVDMGWWSESVLGGDTPLDIIHDLGEHLGVPDTDDESLYPIEDWDDKFRARVKQAIGERFTQEDDAISIWMSENAHTTDVFNIRGQVLAVVWMASGAPMEDVTRRCFIGCFNDDEWAAEDLQRRNCMDDAVIKLQGYGDKPVVVGSKGLIETMVDSFEHGEGGLANKNLGGA